MVFTAHKIVKYFPAWNTMRMGIFSFLVRVKYNLNEKCKGHNENNDDIVIIIMAVGLVTMILIF